MKKVADRQDRPGTVSELAAFTKLEEIWTRYRDDDMAKRAVTDTASHTPLSRMIVIAVLYCGNSTITKKIPLEEVGRFEKDFYYNGAVTG